MRQLWFAPALALACSVATAQVPPEEEIEDPAAAEARFLLAAWTSADVRSEALADGWLPVPLLTHRFYYNGDADAFDAQMYANRIWWPEWSPEEFIPGAVTPDAVNWERFGIPADSNPAGYAGWVDIDFERYTPVRFPEDYPLEEVIRIAQSYIAIAQHTRVLRPKTKLILHGLVSSYGSPGGRAVVEQIASYYDAVSPSIHPRFTEGFTNLADEFTLIHQRLQFSEELRELHGVKIYPILWKRYRPIGHGEINPNTGDPWAIVMPREIARAILLNVAQHDIDGVIVFGPDGRNHYRVEPNWPPDTPTPETVDQTTLRFLEQVQDILEN